MRRLAVSVVVCTRNRAPLLERACRSVLDDPGGGVDWELLVVDNASTDETAALLARLATEYPERVRSVEEPVLGLARARNSGIEHCRGEIVAFLDDDAEAEPGWVEAVERLLRSSGADAVGGPVQPILGGELPEWFCGSLLQYITVWDLGDTVRDLTGPEFPRGTNMAFLRECLVEGSGFSEHLGRRGTNLLSCEETELFARLVRSGRRIVYGPQPVVRHRVPAERLRWSFLARRFFAQGVSEAILDWQLDGRAGLEAGWRRQVGYAVGVDTTSQWWSKSRNLLRRFSLVGYAFGAVRTRWILAAAKPGSADGERAMRRRSSEPQPPAGEKTSP